VSPFEGHVFHNRLTHTLEVAQIAQRLAQHLVKTQKDEARALKVDVNVVEAAALAHDIGHPPFGHLGEEVLSEMLEREGDTDGFEGNAQSFRIITKLSSRGDFPGLNLCRATLNAILKYPNHRSPRPEEKQHWKFGAYRTEAEDLAFARKLFNPGDERKSADAEIMDWADDVAYSVHDLDDFFRAGLIPLERLSQDESARAGFAEKVIKRQEEDAKRRPYLKKPPYSAETIAEVLKALLPSHFTEPYDGSREQRAALRMFTAHLIDRYVRGTPDAPAVKLHVPTDDTSPRLVVSKEARKEVFVLQQLTSTYVFNDPALATVQYGQRHVLETLFDAFLEAARSSDRGTQAVLPRYFRDLLQDFLRVANSNEERDILCVRIAADTIAAMTEQQAVNLFRRFAGYDLNSPLEAIIR
jgi:dGTPase